MSQLIERIVGDGRKKLLAIDGGGIRGVLALGVLKQIESTLAEKSSAPKAFRLCHYFDYIGGTSTGGIIAAGLACGLSVDELLTFYREHGAQMFVRSSLFARLLYKFKSHLLEAELKTAFKDAPTLGADKLQSLLLLVMRNATTDSPWPVSNNPFAKYNDKGRDDCNLRLPLWQLIRASTAAPTYFPPEVIWVGERRFIFVDGGVTMYNNPAFQMFLMATMKAYWPLAPEGKRGWATGEDRMLVVSVGTGTSPKADGTLEPEDMHLLFNAGSIPSALMFAALNEQDLLCRTFGRCLVGSPLDREIGDLKSEPGPNEKKLFTYMRYNAELTDAGLTSLGLSGIDPRAVSKLDSIAGIEDLFTIGEAVGKRDVNDQHFAVFSTP